MAEEKPQRAENPHQQTLELFGSYLLDGVEQRLVGVHNKHEAHSFGSLEKNTFYTPLTTPPSYVFLPFLHFGGFNNNIIKIEAPLRLPLPLPLPLTRYRLGFHRPRFR